MQYLSPIPTLDDARRFLHDATGLPDTINGRERTESYLKAAVIFSWLALEETVRLRIEECRSIPQSPAHPRKLYERIIYCLGALQARRQACNYLQESMQGGGVWEDVAAQQLINDIAFESKNFVRHLVAAEKVISFDRYWTYRKTRNDVVHMNMPMLVLDIAKARACFDYSTEIIGIITGAPVSHKHYDRWGRNEKCWY